ncbi:MAG: hypothetical protein HRT88_17720 [Lentisphaeraceae bacterium]|nr:hypothetical protein [Lentisphaeraceae bacterium]
MSQTEHKVFFNKQTNSPARTAIFLSGSGTNAEKILELWKEEGSSCEFIPACLVTDRPGRCRAEELAKKFNVELVSLDIRQFYKDRGLENTSLATEAGRKVRDEWSTALSSKIKPYNIDFGIFAGFIPLSNITNDFPCLNVHPGDLTELDDKGKRLLIGLHTLPIQTAVLNDFAYLRTSVIVATPYEGEGAGMDEGFVLGISPAEKIDWQRKTPEELIAIYKNRPTQKPKGGWKDEFQQFLSHNQDLLIVGGDWVVFPKVIKDFAAGKFAFAGDNLYLKSNANFIPLEHIEYTSNGKEITFKEGK